MYVIHCTLLYLHNAELKMRFNYALMSDLQLMKWQAKKPQNTQVVSAERVEV